jgi:hypothetical protein
MSQFPEVASNLSTANFRASALTLIRSVAQSTGNLVNFNIPAYNDVVMLYQNASFLTKPTFITFKQDGTIVYRVTLTYDANGALTRVYES